MCQNRWFYSCLSFSTNIQDIPFLILAGVCVYTTQISIFTIFYYSSLAISLLGITSYLIYILRERNSIIDYFLCLKSKFKQSSKFNLHEEPSPGNGGHGTDSHGLAMNVNGQYLGSESEESESDGLVDRDFFLLIVIFLLICTYFIFVLFIFMVYAGWVPRAAPENRLYHNSL